MSANVGEGPRGHPDLKNGRLLNLLARDQMVAAAAFATKQLRKPLKARGMHFKARGMHAMQSAKCELDPGSLSALVPGPRPGDRFRLRLQLSSPSDHFLDHFLDDLADLSP